MLLLFTRPIRQGPGVFFSMSAQNGTHAPGDWRNPIRTGHATVDELYALEKSEGIDFAGPVLPWSWIKGLKTEQGRTYWNAIMVLADIVFHYRANAWKDTEGKYRLKKRFKSDLYHVNSKELCKRLGIVPNVLSRILGYLEREKLIKRDHRRIRGDFFFRQNVFVDLNITGLIKLTHPEEKADSPASRSGGEQIARQVDLLRPERLSGQPSKLICSAQKVDVTKKTSTTRTAFSSAEEKEKNNNNKDAPRAAQADVVSFSPSATQGAKPPEPPEDVSEDSTPEELTNYFVYYWHRSFRQFFSREYVVTNKDEDIALEYFIETNHDPDAVLTYAEKAWVTSAGKTESEGFDKYFHRRRSRSIRYFFQYFGKIMGELKKHAKEHGSINGAKLQKAIEGGLRKDHYEDGE